MNKLNQQIDISLHQPNVVDDIRKKYEEKITSNLTHCTRRRKKKNKMNQHEVIYIYLMQDLHYLSFSEIILAQFQINKTTNILLFSVFCIVEACALEKCRHFEQR